MFNPRGKETGGERRTPAGLPAAPGNLDDVARRLFSCPACGAHWVVFAADGVHIVGARAGRAGDPANTAVVCELCLASVDADGTIVVHASGG